MRGNRNIAILGALRNDFRISFFDAALLKDSQGVLEKQGPNCQHPDMIRFSENTQVIEMAPIITSYLKESIGYADAGIKPPKEQSEIELPNELAEVLEFDPELAAAFHSLTPGRQKSYVINLNAAKKRETRLTRIAKFRDKILAGKGALERQYKTSIFLDCCRIERHRNITHEPCHLGRGRRCGQVVLFA